MDIDFEKKQSIITKYNIDPSTKLPISIPVTESQQVHPLKNLIQMMGIPKKNKKIQILSNDMIPVKRPEQITKAYHYYVDYDQGIIHFHPDAAGNTVEFKYEDIGVTLVSANKIYTKQDEKGNVIELLEDIIKHGREAIDVMITIGGVAVIMKRLEDDIKEGYEVSDKIQADIQQAKDEILSVRGNREVIVKSSDWVLNGDVYEKEITHDLNSENLHVTAKNSDTKEACTIGYKILDKTRILLKSDEAINMSVILSASYYHATQTISDDIAEEVVKARKGETGLDVKITKIDEQLDIIERREYQNTKNITSPYKHNGCIVSWADDDAKQGFLTNLKPLLDARNLKCTIGVITDNIGTADYMTKQELLQLQNEGFDICSHSASHSESIFKDNIASVSEGTIEVDLKRSFDFLRASGFKGYNKLIFPWGDFGVSSIKYKKIARKYFKYALNAHGSYNTSPCDNMYLDRYFIIKTNTIETIKARIDEAIANNGWLILGSHSYSANEFDATLYSQVLDYIISKGVPILNVEEALKYKGNAISSGDYEVNDADKVFIANDGSNNMARKIYPVSTKYKENTPMTEFPLNCHTSFISLGTENSFGVSGIIDVFRVSTKYYSHEIFTPFDKNISYSRKWNETLSVPAFSEWVASITDENLSDKIKETESLKVIQQGYTGTMDDPISVFEQFKETICQITNAKDTLTNVGGVMKVYHGNTNYSYATFMNLQGNFYIRRWNGGDATGSWTAWKQVSFV